MDAAFVRTSDGYIEQVGFVLAVGYRGGQMKDELKTALPGVGGVTAALGSALCCGGPVVAASLGVSGAGLSAFEPFRPYLLVAAAALLVLGFWQLDRQEKAACEPGTPCADPAARKRMRATLWVATVVAVMFATFPSWQTLVF